MSPSSPTCRRPQQGAGGVHHVAFNIPIADYDAWAERLKEMRIPNSGPVDRFWFQSLYFREPNGILFEIATDGPGFATDEPLDGSARPCRCRPSSNPGAPRSRPDSSPVVDLHALERAIEPGVARQHLGFVEARRLSRSGSITAFRAPWRGSLPRWS